jgi:hypothetical protein
MQMMLALFILTAPLQAERPDPDVIWDSPGNHSRDSMPLGNGDIGINVWTDSTGVIRLYIGKSDAWSSFASLLKIGRLALDLSPNPLTQANEFSQHLDIHTGRLIITTGPPWSFKLTLWVDAHQPVIRMEISAQRPLRATITAEPWRTQRRALEGKERHTVYGMINSPNPVHIAADSILDDSAPRLIWFHRNPTSIWKETLQRQGLEAWTENHTDPLLHRTFGIRVEGPNWIRDTESSLKLSSPRSHTTLDVTVHTAVTETTTEWLEDISSKSDHIRKLDWSSTKQAHLHWWKQFWDKSWIELTGSPDAERVSRAYALQRYMNACAGRGEYPIKFNGSLFNVDSVVSRFPYDADFRQWGGPYWLQNTRLIYWSMLYAGDIDLMQPFFHMYKTALPFNRFMTRTYYDHQGAFFPETMYFWGGYAMDNFGWQTEVVPFRFVENRYIRYYYQGGLEVSALMLDTYAFSQNSDFLTHTALPFIESVVRFYDEHYRLDDAGTYRLEPAQALETYWQAVNPTPPVAGLQWVVSKVLTLPDSLLHLEQRDFFKLVFRQLPPIPVGEKEGRRVVLPGEQVIGEPRNHENPEFYAIFPYRHFGVNKPNLAWMIPPFENARVKDAKGWQHYDLNAALMGYTEIAQDLLVKRTRGTHENSRFPVFWGPNYDWVPDQDHGSCLMLTLQRMLMQKDRIFLFPAWPPEWDVRFKIHAPLKTVIEGEFRDGSVVSLNIVPEHRRNDIVNCLLP